MVPANTKIRVSPKHFENLEKREAELRDLIQSGNDSPFLRVALSEIQTVLPIIEVDPTWIDGPTPPETA